MLGVLVNTLGVVFGCLLGLLLRRGIPKKVEQGVMAGMGLCIILIGVQGALDGMNAIIMILSMVIGAIIGGFLDIDRQVNRLGDWVERRFRKNGSQVSLAEGFVSATLLFCVGAMTIVGSINSGLRGDHEMLCTKALLDMFSAMMMSVTMGVGVMLSAVSVLVIQGAIALGAGLLEPLLTPETITQVASVGSVLIMGIGVNFLREKKMKIANFLPAIVVAPLLVWIAGLFA